MTMMDNATFWLVLRYLGAIVWMLLALFAIIKSRQAFNRRNFPDVVNISLNHFVGPVLQWRTLWEGPADQLWLNKFAVRLIIKASKNAAKTGDPLLCLADKDPKGCIKRAVLNKLSGLFREVHLARALGHDVATSWFYFAVTYEPFEWINEKKMRIMVISESDFEELEFAPDQTQRYAYDHDHEHEHRAHRLETLKRMYWIAKDDERQHALGKVELGMPIGASDAGDTPTRRTT